MSRSAQLRVSCTKTIPNPSVYILALNGELSDWSYDEERAPAFRGKWRKSAFACVADTRPLDLEIGTGNGLHFAHHAAQHPERLLAGIELKYKPLIQSIRRARRLGCENVRVARYNAALLTELFEPGELNDIFIYFPDPWEKTRNHKHRLIQDEFLQRSYSAQKPGSRLLFKTDSADYFRWAMTRFERSSYRVEATTSDLHQSEFLDQNFRVSGEWVRITGKEQNRFNTEGRNAFPATLKPGEYLKQPNLAKALRLLRDQKLSGFYSGSVANDLVSTVKANGGLIQLADLQNYKARWLTPLTVEFAGQKLYLMPPPSSGGVVVETALKLIDKIELKKHEFLSLDELHLLSEIEARAFRGRAALGDPDFHHNPIDELTSDKAISELGSSIKLTSTVPPPPLPEKWLHDTEKQETTHFSVMDAQGHAVALTVTLNGGYGSAVVSDRYHIALNNQMDDFNTRPGEANMYGLTQGEGNRVEPGKRPLSSMTPTLVETDGKITLSIGAPGGPRIISAVLQALYRILGQKLDLDLAIQAPRLHHQFSPDKVYVDVNRLSPEILQGLKARGHVVETASGMGKVYAVRLRADGILEGAFDARGEGAAGGF